MHPFFTAVEATTLNERSYKLRPQDRFLRNNIRPNDILIVSVGGNDVALCPTPCTIVSMLGVLSLPVTCVENGFSCGVAPVRYASSQLQISVSSSLVLNILVLKVQWLLLWMWTIRTLVCLYMSTMSWLLSVTLWSTSSKVYRGFNVKDKTKEDSSLYDILSGRGSSAVLGGSGTGSSWLQL
jgi:hypothetical protein